MSCPCKACRCSPSTPHAAASVDLSINGTLNKANSLSTHANAETTWSTQKYPFNIDLVPKVIRKKSKCAECNQDVTIKYLEPNKTYSPSSTPSTINTTASTPILINQTYSRISTTPSIIIRRIPCQQSCHTSHTNLIKTPPIPYETVITIPGELLSPQPRKVVIEIVSEMPQPPPPHQPEVQRARNNAEILERYREYQDLSRQMLNNPKQSNQSEAQKQKNLILNWEKRDCAEVKTNIKNLGVESADPNEYAQKYGPSLVATPELPEIASRAKSEHGYLLAADLKHKYFSSLEGDVHALGLIDLDKEGLSEYKYLVEDSLKKKNSSQSEQ